MKKKSLQSKKAAAVMIPIMAAGCVLICVFVKTGAIKNPLPYIMLVAVASLAGCGILRAVLKKDIEILRKETAGKEKPDDKC